MRRAVGSGWQGGVAAAALTLSAVLAVTTPFARQVQASGEVPAADAAPAPADSPSPASDATQSATPDPVATATPDPTAAPDPVATATPDPTVAPDPVATATPDPTADPAATPTPDPITTSDPTPSPSSTPAPTPTPLPPGAIGPDGGSITWRNVALDFPPGAVGLPVRITLAAASGPGYGGLASLQVFSLSATDLESGYAVGTFGVGVDASLGLGSIDLAGVQVENLHLARLIGGAWEILPTRQAGSRVAASIDGPGLYGVLEVPAPTAMTVLQGLTAPADGRRRVDPGAPLSITLTARPDHKLYAGTMVLVLPDGWTVTGDGGGTFDPTSRTLAWPLASIPGGMVITRSADLIGPTLTLDGGLVRQSVFSARVDQTGALPQRAPDVSVLVAPRAVIEHDVFADIDPLTRVPEYGGVDAPRLAQPVFRDLRIRFRLENADSLSVTVNPRLEVRRVGEAGAIFELVPGPVDFGTAPFHVASERVDGSTGIATIASDDARMDGLSGRTTAFVAGGRAEGLNPLGAVVLPGDGATEVEFVVSATVSADYLASYEFRITDAGSPIEPSAMPVVQIGPEPSPDLSPGQRTGTVVGSAVAYPLVIPKAPAPAGVSGSSGSSPHGGYTMNTDSCAICHRAHSAPTANLLTAGPPQSLLCYLCHNGTGARSDIQAEYAVASSNNPSTASYYQHDESNSALHADALDPEFAGVLDRHSECTDCHDPHAAAPGESVQTTGGWTVPGSLSGASGVAVTNGAPGTQPGYTFLRPDSSGTYSQVTLEYQVCFKCHSSYTILPARDPTQPSTWTLDKGRELNPANLSYHPIEAAGKNGSSQMAASLSGTSPYKLWSFSTSSTIRCTNCHGAPASIADPSPSPAPGPGTRIDTHVSSNPGILLGNYRDQLLHVRDDSYTALEFQLCYLCHAEAPFTTANKDPQSDTNFPLHGLHVAYLQGEGVSTNQDIDAAGAGAGNAVCAECHFRIHSTASVDDLRTGTLQTGDDAGLAVFAPNVQPNGGTLSWARDGSGSGSCTLTCHGESHGAAQYRWGGP